MTTDRVHPVLQYVGLERTAPRSDAERAWRMLDKGTRRQVSRLARHGRAHPDPQVSSVALAWAMQKRSHLRADLATMNLVVVACIGLAMIFSLLLHWAAWTFVGVAALPGSVFGEQRLARKVEAANRRR